MLLRHLGFTRRSLSSSSFIKKPFKESVQLVQDGSFEGAFDSCWRTVQKLSTAETHPAAPQPQSAFVDHLGRPTGGAESPSEVVEDILNQRKANALKRRDALPRATKFDELSAVLDQVDAKDTVVGLSFKSNLYFHSDHTVATMKYVEQYIPFDEALSSLRLLAEEHDKGSALYTLGALYYDGKAGVLDQDVKKAVGYFEKAAELGDANARFLLANYYHHGDPNEDTEMDTGIRQDNEKAIQLLNLAVASKHPSAMVYLAKMLLAGEVPGGSESENYLQAVDLLKESGDGEGLFLLADLHREPPSSVIEQDLQKSRRYCEEACREGHTDACLSAGAMYYHGLGGEQDFFESYKCYEAAAKRGSLEAWKNIASMYYEGKGVPQDTQTAEEIVAFVKDMEEKLKNA